MFFISINAESLDVAEREEFPSFIGVADVVLFSNEHFNLNKIKLFIILNIII